MTTSRLAGLADGRADEHAIADGVGTLEHLHRPVCLRRVEDSLNLGAAELAYGSEADGRGGGVTRPPPVIAGASDVAAAERPRVRIVVVGDVLVILLDYRGGVGQSGAGGGGAAGVGVGVGVGEGDCDGDAEGVGDGDGAAGAMDVVEVTADAVALGTFASTVVVPWQAAVSRTAAMARMARRTRPPGLRRFGAASLAVP